jgi:predicted ester cyclase
MSDTEATTETPAKPQTTAKIAKAYFGAIANRDLDTAVSLWKPGSRDLIHGVADMTAPDDIRTFFTGMWSAFPDWTFEILELAASGKNAACRWHTTATFTGPGRFQGLAPTGGSIDIEGCDMLRVEDGEIVENNAYLNGALMAQQLGLLPAEGSFGDRAFTSAFNAKTAAANALRKLRES